MRAQGKIFCGNRPSSGGPRKSVGSRYEETKATIYATSDKAGHLIHGLPLEPRKARYRALGSGWSRSHTQISAQKPFNCYLGWRAAHFSPSSTRIHSMDWKQRSPIWTAFSCVEVFVYKQEPGRRFEPSPEPRFEARLSI